MGVAEGRRVGFAIKRLLKNVKIMAALKDNYRREKFALALFQGMSQKDAAIQAGYSAKTARQIGSRLLTKVDIVARILELHQKAESDATMSVRERKEHLSEIARKGNPNLADPISAIRELNKMEGSYPPEKHALLGEIIFRVIYDNDSDQRVDNPPAELPAPSRPNGLPSQELCAGILAYYGVRAEIPQKWSGSESIPLNETLVY